MAAYREDQLDPNSPDYGNAASPYNAGPADTGMYDAVAGIYQTALGRAGSADEINGWVNGPMSGDLGGIQTAIYGSPEGQAWGSRNATPPPAAAPEAPAAPAPVEYAPPPAAAAAPAPAP